MTNKLFIGSLSYSITDTILFDYFAKVGNVLSAKAIIDRTTGQGKGFGFVEMSSPEEAKQAIGQLNNTQLDGRMIVVKEARPQEDRSKRAYTNNNRW